MPQIAYDSEDAIPEPFREIAEPKDGKFVIDVAPSKDLKEFRENNIKLSQERDELMGKVAKWQADLGIDDSEEGGYDKFLENLQAYKDTYQQVEDGKLVKDTSLEEAVNARTREMKSEHENLTNSLKTKLNAYEAETKTLKGKLARAQVDREFMQAINDPKSGALSEASDTILMFAYDNWSPDENGKLVARDSDNKIIYGADGSSPMTPMEWLGKLREQKPFLFKQSEGGGGQGGGGAGNLTSKELQNMSPQERMNYARENGLTGAN